MKRILSGLVISMVILSGCNAKTDSLKLSGEIEANIVSANTVVSGKITKMNKQLGQQVKAGEVIAEIDSVNQKYLVQQLETVVNLKQVNYEAAKDQDELLANDTSSQMLKVSKLDLKQAKIQLAQAKANLDNYTIKALNNGIIISKIFGLGDVVTPGSNIADIAISGDLNVVCYIPVEKLGEIKYGQQVKVKSEEAGELVGNINYIDLNSEYNPSSDSSSSERIATKVKVAISENKGILKPGMKVEVVI